MKTIREAFIGHRDNAIDQKANLIIQKKFHDGLEKEDELTMPNSEGQIRKIKRGNLIKSLDLEMGGIDLIISKIDELLKEENSLYISCVHTSRNKYIYDLVSK